MRSCRIHPLWPAFALAALGSASFAQASQVDPARAPVEKQGLAFAEAFNRGDIVAVAAMYAEDAIAFPPDSAMVRGRPAIEALWKGARDSGIKAVTFNVEDVQSAGNLAVEVGTAVLKIQPANQPETSQTIKYVVVWKCQKDGAWKLHRDIWNGMPAPAK